MITMAINQANTVVMVVYDHQLVIVGAPSLPVTINTTEEERSQQSAGITSVSEPEFLVFKEHVVMPSIH